MIHSTRGLAPEIVVALVFEVDIVLEGHRIAEVVDDDRVIDDEIDGAERVDLARVASKTVHSVTHGSKINDGGNTAIIQIKS